MKSTLLSAIFLMLAGLASGACPTVTISDSARICDADSFRLSAELVGVATLQWFTMGTGTFGNAGTNGIYYIPSQAERQNGTFRVGVYTVTSDTCSSSSDTVTFTILPSPQGSFTATPTSGAAPLAVDFSANVNFGTDTGTYTWIFGDGDTTRKIEDPSHIYQVNGTYSIRLILTNQETCTDSVVRMNYIQVGPAGIAEGGAAVIQAFPNPASNQVLIRTSEGQGIEEVQLVNLSGQMLIREESVAQERVILQVGEIPRGIYILNIKMASGAILSQRILLE